MMKNLSKLILLLSLSSANLCFGMIGGSSFSLDSTAWTCKHCLWRSPAATIACGFCESEREGVTPEMRIIAALYKERCKFELNETAGRNEFTTLEAHEFDALLEEYRAFLDAQAALASSSASSSSSSEAAPRAKSPSRGRSAAPEDNEVRSTCSHDSRASFQTRFSVASGFMPNTPEFPENTSEMISEIKAIRESKDINALVNFTRWAGWDKGYNIFDRATGQSTAVPYLSEDEIRTLFQFSSDGAPLSELVFQPGREMPRAHWRFIGQIHGRPMGLSLFLFLAKGTICFNPEFEPFVPASTRTAIALLKAKLDQSKFVPSSGAPRAYAPGFAASSSSPVAPASASSPELLAEPEKKECVLQ